MKRALFVLNPGSSTLKFAVYQPESTTQIGAALTEGSIEHLGTGEARLHLKGWQRADDVRNVGVKTPAQAVTWVVHHLQAAGKLPPLEAVACRVVHGGSHFHAPTLANQDTLKAIRERGPLAPLHNPAAAEMIEACQSLLPGVPVYVVFDTAFHSTIPEVAATYALPTELSQRYNLRRYGFHGLSHRHVSEQLLRCLGREAQGTRLITCHLGSGASICAVKDGKSVDTSMGFTPMEGLIMGTRCGDIDPGLIIHLLRERHISLDELDDILNHKSGLRGLSGQSAEVHQLEEAVAQGHLPSDKALAAFAYRLRKYIGAYAAALGGLDGIAFTGGIGENSPAMRKRTCEGLGFLGVELEEERNRGAVRQEKPVCISPDTARVPIWVIPTDEQIQIAQEVCRVIR